jgi:hypothetical protein
VDLVKIDLDAPVARPEGNRPLPIAIHAGVKPDQLRLLKLDPFQPPSQFDHFGPHHLNIGDDGGTAAKSLKH